MSVAAIFDPPWPYVVPWPNTYPQCTCPVAWWGLTPPPCPVHNPPGQTFTSTSITIIPQPEPKPDTQKGWECPRCSRINAPHTPWCCKEKP